MTTSYAYIYVTALLFFLATGTTGSSWSDWWTYEGISGPEFWGLVNPEWNLCSRGRRQSPIDVLPQDLLYDPQLKGLNIDKHKVSGTLLNTGHDLKLTLEEHSAHHVNVSGGPLSYHYRVAEVSIHFGNADDTGSEHSIAGYHLPAEIQILCYNHDLYSNLTQASQSSNGLAVVSILAKIGEETNKELDSLVKHAADVKYKGQKVHIKHISVDNLIPDIRQYVTYEGSLTQPGCQETVTWIVLNRPTFINRSNLLSLRQLMQGDINNPKFPMHNNRRPVMPLHYRTVRANIESQSKRQECEIEKQFSYKANIFRNNNTTIRRSSGRR